MSFENRHDWHKDIPLPVIPILAPMVLGMALFLPIMLFTLKGVDSIMKNVIEK